MHTEIASVTNCLKAIVDPISRKTWADLNTRIQVNAENNELRAHVVFAYPIETELALIKAQAVSALSARYPFPVDLKIEGAFQSHENQLKKRVKGIKNIVLVGSGKGGVGKSTVCVNLALAFKLLGAKVGLLDGDVYGPSFPTMLGVKGKAKASEDKKFIPIEAHGVPSLSMGYLTPAGAPMVWRGPMISSALQQMVDETVWPELDILFIDLPPGTGDIPLTIAQKIPVSGAVVVTTPQNVATDDATKALAMFEKMDVPVLGVVENMSYYHCPSCAHEEPLFGMNGGATLAKRHDTTLLGQLPLNGAICQLSDSGSPIVMHDGPEKDLFIQLAQKTARALASRPVDYSIHFGQVKVTAD